MKNFIIAWVVVATLSAPSIIPAREITITSEEIEKANDPVETIKRVADENGIDSDILISMAECESSVRHNGVYGDNGKSYGIMQFQRPTFDLFKGISGIDGLEYENEKDQIVLTAWAVKNGFGDHWTCYRKYVQEKM